MLYVFPPYEFLRYNSFELALVYCFAIAALGFGIAAVPTAGAGRVGFLVAEFGVAEFNLAAWVLATRGFSADAGVFFGDLATTFLLPVFFLAFVFAAVFFAAAEAASSV